MAEKLQLLTLTARRAKQGVLFTAKVDPLIEEFFKNDSMRAGATQPRFITSTGCFMNPGYLEDPANTPILEFYAQTNDLTVAGGDMYSSAVTSRRNGLRDGSYVNISWLRIPKISEGEGVKFFIQGVFPSTDIQTYVDSCAAAVQKLFYNHLAP